MSESRVVRTSCRGCHGVCQVLVHLDSEGNPFKVTGDPESPTSLGYICPKGWPGPKSSGTRTGSPPRCAGQGPRGSGQWQPVSWDEAIGDDGADVRSHSP